MPYLFLAGAFICNAAANVLLKVAAQKGFTFGALLRGELGSPALFAAGAVVLFALNLAFYLVSLEKIPLSVGYPIMIGMTFFITIGASLFLGERLGYIHLVGMILILAGIFLIVRFAGAV